MSGTYIVWNTIHKNGMQKIEVLEVAEPSPKVKLKDMFRRLADSSLLENGSFSVTCLTPSVPSVWLGEATRTKIEAVPTVTDVAIFWHG